MEPSFTLATPDTGAANPVAPLVLRDERALEALYDRYSTAIYSLALRIVHHPEVAEEIVQETFLRVWRGAEQYQGDGRSFEAWLFRIARNLSLDQLRRRATRPQTVILEAPDSEQPSPVETLADESVDVAEQAWERWRRQQVRQALTTLPTEQRRAIELAYFEGLTHREIAERLAEPLGTIKTRLRLGLQKLGLLCQQYGLEL